MPLGVRRQVVHAALDDAGRSLQTLDESVLDIVPVEDRLPEASLLADEKIRHLPTAVTHLPECMLHIIEQVFFEGHIEALTTFCVVPWVEHHMNGQAVR